MAERDTNFFEVVVGQIAQNARINVVLGKALRVLPQAKLLEPLRNLLHWLHRHRVGGWPNFRPTAKKRYPNVSGIARLACSNSPASAFDYFAKVVRQYGCSLPRSAWYVENNCIRPISATGSVA